MTYPTYLFDIVASNGSNYYFTSSAQSVLLGGVRYINCSGLTVVKAKFNDSGQDHVLIHGLLESEGIAPTVDMTGAKVKIMPLVENQASLLAVYTCTKYIVNDLEFEMKCEAMTVKYKQSLLNVFSKTCRANFGDEKCKISLATLAVSADVINISDHMITCTFHTVVQDGYFTGGKVIIPESVFVLGNLSNTIPKAELRIKSHVGGELQVNTTSAISANDTRVIVLPGCDKSYRTCCYSYNNAVNFRGEPMIPENGVLQN